MFGKKLTRRDFLRGSAMVAVGAAAWESIRTGHAVNVFNGF